jgi:chloramphenicol-sensitive protein RarD
VRATVVAVTDARAGLAAGLAGYALWGLVPLFWPLLEPSAPVEILAHRIVWSLVFVVVVLAVRGGFGWVRTLDRRRVRLLALAAVLVTVNWGTYIYAVNSGHVVESSLGYFINPLVTVLLALTVLRERLDGLQPAAVGLALVGVLVLTVQSGRVPWVALVLACSFGLYGLIKKQVGMEGTQSTAVETTCMLLPSLAYIAYLELHGTGTFASEGAGHAALMAAGGIVTALPLVLFGAAAIRLPLVTLGLLQYITPTLQFLIGVVVRGEPMPAARLAGFVVVWAALAVFTWDALRRRRTTRTRAAVMAAP